MAMASTSTFAYELNENVNFGLYGDVTYSQYDSSEIEDIKTSSNAYVELRFKENINVMLDYNYQYEQWSNDTVERDLSSDELYQAYVEFDGKSFALKAGRFADFYTKGQNSLDTMGAMVHSQIAPLLVFGQANYSTIDGVSLDYKYPLNDGQFVATFYGGIQTEQYNHDIEKAVNLSLKSDKYGLHVDAEKQDHRFLFGMEFSDIDEGEVEGVTDDFTDFENVVTYKSVYLTYQFENDFIFSDNTYLLNEYETTDDSYLQSVLDLKIGTNFKNFKPFVGYNIFEDQNDKYETITYGVRYDYKDKVGFVVKRDSIDKLAGSALEDQRWTASFIYNL